MTLGLALSVFFTVGWVSLYFFRVEDIPDALPVYTPSERLWVGATVAIMSAHVTLGCVTTSLSAVPVWRAAVSVIVFAFGIAFWLWARSLIGPVRERRSPDVPPLRLRTDAAFGVVRHPLYLGCVIAASAPVVAAARPFLLVTLCSCIVSLGVRAAQEERRLHEQLGPPYAAYCAHVRRLIPFVW